MIYVLSDQGFQIDGYSWLLVYFVAWPDKPCGSLKLATTSLSLHRRMPLLMLKSLSLRRLRSVVATVPHVFVVRCLSKVFIVVEMVFVKFVVDTVPMSTWTRVYYNNTLRLCGKEEWSTGVTERAKVCVQRKDSDDTGFLPEARPPHSPIHKLVFVGS